MYFLVTIVLLVSILFPHFCLHFLIRSNNKISVHIILANSFTLPSIVLFWLPFALLDHDFVFMISGLILSTSYLMLGLVFLLITKTNIISLFFNPVSKSLRTAFNGCNSKFGRLTIFSFTTLGLIVFFSFWSDLNFFINPRIFYQNYRQGIGLVWSCYVSLLGILQGLVLYNILTSKHIKQYFLYSIVFIFLILAYFSGSKLVIATVFLQSFILMCIFNKKEAKRILAFSPIVVVFLSINFFSNLSNLSFDYFLNYANSWKLSRLLVSDIIAGTFDYFNGEIFFTNIFSYIPRSIFPDKPFAYGPTLLLENYFPGMAATGHSPSFGPSMSYIADFGIPLGNLVYALTPRVILTFYSCKLVLNFSDDNLSKFSLFLVLSVASYSAFMFHIPVFLGLPIYYFASKLTTFRHLSE